ncbi:hypothetical protein XA68_17049 [Ophiocordyceps unilateralis]|uniref:Histone chaperone domain-containing protein n=1 Tax=Ophiocordyceps unilateralis TaxID=268505 RepID=A0A2A9PL44_OPHUN|nr:hypothetical protein XA68_17049 [Ophiocordyceps unilateralis]
MADKSDTLPAKSAAVEEPGADTESKGKGKAVAEDVPKEEVMEEDDDDEDDDDEEEEEAEDNAEGGEEEDGMEEIDLKNIVEGGRRTRGAKIDFAKAAEENPADEEDEEDDDDFKPPPEDTSMSG